MNIDTAYIACLFENSSDTMAIRKIERDLAFEEQLIEAEQDFWENYVLKGVEPPFVETPELCFSTIDKYVQAQFNKNAFVITGFDESLARIAELRAEKKRLEDEQKAIQKQKAIQNQIDSLVLPIIDAMGNNTSGTATVGSTRYDITYKPMERTGINKDNLKRLQINAPDIYDQYVTTTSSRRLSFKTTAV